MDACARARLVNLLARTTSPHDGEALAAGRKANELLSRHRLAWSDIITAERVEPDSEPRHPPGWGNDLWGDQPASWRQPEPLQEAAVYAPLTFAQRLARVCLGLGIGSGIAISGIFALLFHNSGTGDALTVGVICGGWLLGPSLIGALLWFLLGGGQARDRAII